MPEVTLIADFPDDTWIDMRGLLSAHAARTRNALIVRVVRSVIPPADLDDLGPKLICSLVLKGEFQPGEVYVAQVAAIRAEFARLCGEVRA